MSDKRKSQKVVIPKTKSSDPEANANENVMRSALAAFVVEKSVLVSAHVSNEEDATILNKSIGAAKVARVSFDEIDNTFMTRNINDDHVAKLHDGWNIDLYRHSPIILASISGKYVLVDGQHRYRVMQMMNSTSALAVIIGGLDDRLIQDLSIVMNNGHGQRRTKEDNKKLAIELYGSARPDGSKYTIRAIATLLGVSPTTVYKIIGPAKEAGIVEDTGEKRGKGSSGRRGKKDSKDVADKKKKLRKQFTNILKSAHFKDVAQLLEGYFTQCEETIESLEKAASRASIQQPSSGNVQAQTPKRTRQPSAGSVRDWSTKRGELTREERLRAEQLLNR